MSRTIYINRKDCYGNLETVDEFSANDFRWRRDFIKYVKKMLNEYQIGERSAHYYMSQKACKAWIESYKEEEDD